MLPRLRVPFDSLESVDKWVSEHSRAELEENIAGGRFAHARLKWAQAWLNRQQERDLVAGAEEAIQRKAAEDERQLAVADRAATATESQARTAAKALSVAKWALGVSI